MMIEKHLILKYDQDGVIFTEYVQFGEGFKAFDEAIAIGERKLKYAVEKFNFIKGELIFEEIADLYKKSHEILDPIILENYLRTRIQDLHYKIEAFTKDRKKW